MGELNNIFSKLNIMEQAQLNKYINVRINTKIQECNQMIDEARNALEQDNRELREYYSKTNAETWERIGVSLHVAMRELHISEERIDKINTRLKELNEKHDLLLGEEQKSEYKILHHLDFAKMIELLMNGNCRNCHSRNYKCEVYKLLKKYNIPYSPGKCKCKYGYLKIGKKVV